VSATLNVTAIIKINGTTAYQALIFSQTFEDITSTTASSTGKGNIGAASGIEDIVQRAFGGIGPFSLTSSGQYAAPDRMVTTDLQFQGGVYNTPVVMFKAHLKNAYVGNFGSQAPKKFLGSTQRRVASTGHFNLAGGYIVDCLTDQQAASSPYRSDSSNPYNRFGLPDNGEGAPPDGWFYMTDANSRRTSLFNPHLRESCGLLGTSSAAIALQGNVNNGTLCCDGTLIDGGCVPGGAHPDAVASPENILANGTLWKQSFSPPGYRSYNYYMYGQNLLYMQPPRQSVSGLSPLLNGAATAVFEIVMEVSDLIVRPKTGSSATQAVVPPLRLEVDPESVFQAYSPEEPVVCVYNPGGRGAVVFQRLCNVGSGSAAANITVTFENCRGVRFPGPNDSFVDQVGPIRLNSNRGSLLAGTCYDLSSLPIHVDLDALLGGEQVGCESYFVSSTLGSTREIDGDGFTCTRFDKPWNAPVVARGYTLTIDDLDPECKRCDGDDLGCLNQCGKAYSSVWMVIIFWIPVVGGSVAMILTIFILSIQGYFYDRTEKHAIRRRIWKTEQGPDAKHVGEVRQ
jgi:hypothetical protein